MKSVKDKLVFIGLSSIIVLAVFGVANLLMGPSLDAGERDAAAFGEVFPLVYESYLKTGEMERTAYGGSEPYDYIENYPFIKSIYAGIGFSLDYRRSRGHIYALEDALNTARPKPGATCLTCKSADVPDLLAEYGADYYTMDFDMAAAEASHNMSCSDCHQPGSMEHHITRPALTSALEDMGRDPDALTRQEMGSLLCAQCHVEYYFEPGTLKVTYPWQKGLGVADMEAYFDQIGFSDWTHPDTGAGLIKIQHPEYELYQGSTHDAMGVSCADCHMPEKTAADGTAYVSHWWTSPLKHVEESCAACHSDTDVIVAQTEELQGDVYQEQNRVGELLAAYIQELAAKKDGLEPETLEEAQSIHRRAQIRWDFVFVENSTGFHNYAKSIQYLQSAEELLEDGFTLLH